MLSSQLLARFAFVGLVLVGLVMLTDGMARSQLERAVGGFTGSRAGIPVQVAAAVD